MQYKTVSPVGNRVFVKVDNEEATSAGGILLPTSAQKKPTQGEVVSLGDAQSLKVRRIVLNISTLRVQHSEGATAAARIICPSVYGMAQNTSRITHDSCTKWLDQCESTSADGTHSRGSALQAGDKVVYSKYAGTEVALDKTDYVLLKVSMPPA